MVIDENFSTALRLEGGLIGIQGALEKLDCSYFRGTIAAQIRLK